MITVLARTSGVVAGALAAVALTWHGNAWLRVGALVAAGLFVVVLHGFHHAVWIDAALVALIVVAVVAAARYEPKVKEAAPTKLVTATLPEGPLHVFDTVQVAGKALIVFVVPDGKNGFGSVGHPYAATVDEGATEAETGPIAVSFEPGADGSVAAKFAADLASATAIYVMAPHDAVGSELQPG